MIDQALPRPLPVAGDPVDHVAAIGSAQRARAIAVEPGILLQCMRPAFLKVFERPVTPMADDRACESLTISSRPVKIDLNGCIAHAGKELRVPPIAPAIARVAVRSTVNDKCHRVFAPFDKTLRPDEVPINRLAVPTGKAELLNGSHWRSVEQVLADLGQRSGCAAHQIVQLAWAAKTVRNIDR